LVGLPVNVPVSLAEVGALALSAVPLIVSIEVPLILPAPGAAIVRVKPAAVPPVSMLQSRCMVV